jgi:hypothetical protein
MALRAFGRPAAAARLTDHTQTPAPCTNLWLRHWASHLRKPGTAHHGTVPNLPYVRGRPSPERPPLTINGASRLQPSGGCCAADCSHPNSWPVLSKYLATPLPVTAIAFRFTVGICSVGLPASCAIDARIAFMVGKRKHTKQKFALLLPKQ